MSLPESHAAATSSTALCSESCSSGVNLGSVQGLEGASTIRRQLATMQPVTLRPHGLRLWEFWVRTSLSIILLPPTSMVRATLGVATYLFSEPASTRIRSCAYHFLSWTQKRLRCADLWTFQEHAPRLLGFQAIRLLILPCALFAASVCGLFDKVLKPAPTRVLVDGAAGVALASLRTVLQELLRFATCAACPHTARLNEARTEPRWCLPTALR